MDLTDDPYAQLTPPDVDQRTGAIKGRGAISNPHNRFHHQRIESVADGWDLAEDAPPAPKTTTLIETSKTIISENRSPDIPFDYSINPYRGCEHGCIYCYARPTHAFWDMSPGLDFESKIVIKPDAAKLLRQKLDQPNYEPRPLCIGANTDPYQPLESQLEITRSIIEVLAEYRHPFSIITKSNLILRDLDLLAPLAEANLCSVAVSVTTLDNNLKRLLEPRTPAGQVRLKTIRGLSEAGVRVTMLAAPMIPYINDGELETLLEAGRDAGAVAARYILLRLPLEISEMFQDWLNEHFPDRAAKVMSIIRQSRGGNDYRSAFGERMVGTGHFAELLNARWKVASKKLGFNIDLENGSEAGLEDIQRFALDYSQFKRSNEQLKLF